MRNSQERNLDSSESSSSKSESSTRPKFITFTQHKKVNLDTDHFKTHFKAA